MKASELIDMRFNKKYLADDLNRFRRQHFIKIKDTMFSSIKVVEHSTSALRIILAMLWIFLKARKFPEPTRENIKKESSHIWMDIFDEYFEYEKCERVKEIINAFRKVLIGLNEHSSPYTDRFGWFVKRIQEKGWKPLPAHKPYDWWAEPSVLKAKQERVQRILAESKIFTNKIQPRY